MTDAIRLLRERINPKRIRRIILTQSHRAHVGHIGSCLSVVEILSALYTSVIRAEGPHDPNRDRFVLSKGHAGLLYATLYLKGWISQEELNTFCGDNTLLGRHRKPHCPGLISRAVL